MSITENNIPCPSAAMAYFNQPHKSRSKNATKSKLVFALPRDLHKMITEVSYREEITLTSFVEAAANKLIERMDMAEDKGNCRYSVAVSGGAPLKYSAEGLVHPTVYIPKSTLKDLKDAAHYGSEFGVVSLRHLIMDMLVLYLRSFTEKYPDVLDRL